jgi:hypothetical protein
MRKIIRTDLGELMEYLRPAGSGCGAGAVVARPLSGPFKRIGLKEVILAHGRFHIEAIIKRRKK